MTHNKHLNTYKSLYMLKHDQISLNRMFREYYFISYTINVSSIISSLETQRLLCQSRQISSIGIDNFIDLAMIYDYRGTAPGSEASDQRIRLR